MLSVNALLSQLNTLQQLAVEKNLQARVAYDSSVLSIFNSMMLGESRQEIFKSCYLNETNYAKLERPILVAIHESYGLKPENARDQFLGTVHYAIHEEEFADNSQKTKRLEDLFHQMKRYHLEQESAELLKELTKISKGSPLHAVYSHLYHKYDGMEKHNNLAYQAFEKLNIQLSDFLDSNLGEYSTRDLIKSYKEVRRIHEANENRVSETILNVSMLLLASHCNQTQLLKEKGWDMTQLFETCHFNISEMHFSVERLFMDTIFNQTLTHAIEQSQIKISNCFFQRLSVNAGSNDHYNFGFELPQPQSTKTNHSKELLIRDFVKKITTFSPKQNSFMIRPNQI